METAITIDEDFTLDVIEDTEGLEGESETLRGQDENLNISSLLRDLPLPVTSKTKEDLTESIIISDSDDEEKKPEIQIPPEPITFECSIISSKEFMKMVGKLPKVTPPNCNLCAFTTDRGLRVLQVHYLNEHKLSCHLCDFWTINMEQMIDHWTVIHKLKTFKCVTCGAIYHVEEDIIQHLKLMHNLEAKIQKNFACKLCSFVTDKAADVVDHLKLTHRKFAVIKQLKSKPTPPPKPQPKTYQQRRGGNPKTPSKPRRTFKESNAEPVRRRSTRQVVRRLEPSVYVQEQVKQRSKPKQAKKQKQTTQDEDEDEDVDVFTIEKSVKQKNGTMSYQVKKIIFKPTEPYSPPIFDAIKFRKVQDIMKSVVMNSNLPEGHVPVQLIEKAVPEPKTVASATSFEAFYNQNFQVDDDDDDDDDDDGEKGADRQPEVGQSEESIEELILKEIEAEKVSNAKNIFTRLPQTEALPDKYFDKQPIEKNVMKSEEASTSSNVTETEIDFAGGLSNRSQNPILNKLLSKKSGERCCLKNYSQSATFANISEKVVSSHLQKDAKENIQERSPEIERLDGPAVQAVVGQQLLKERRNPSPNYENSENSTVSEPKAQTQLVHKEEVPEDTKSRQAEEGSLQTVQETSFKVPERLFLKDSQSDEEPNPSKLIEADGTRVPVADSQLDLQETQKQCSSVKLIPNSKDVKESSGLCLQTEGVEAQCLDEEAEMPEELVSNNPQEESNSKSFDGDLQETNINETQARFVQDFAEEAIREAQQDSQLKEDCQEAEVLENKVVQAEVPNFKESEQKMETSSTCTKILQSQSSSVEGLEGQPQESEECTEITEEPSVCAEISDIEAIAERTVPEDTKGHESHPQESKERTEISEESSVCAEISDIEAIAERTVPEDTKGHESHSQESEERTEISEESSVCAEISDIEAIAEESGSGRQSHLEQFEPTEGLEVLENKVVQAEVPNSKESEQKMETSSTCTKILQSQSSSVEGLEGQPQESEECTEISEESSVCAEISDIEAIAERTVPEDTKGHESHPQESEERTEISEESSVCAEISDIEAIAEESHLEQFEPTEGSEVLEDKVVQPQIPNSKDLELNVQAPTTCQKIIQSQFSPVEGLEGQPTLESEEVCLESISSLEILQTEIEYLDRKLTEEKVCCSEDSMIVQRDSKEMSEMLDQDREKSEDFVEESQRLKERDNSSKTPQTEAPLLDDDKEQSEKSLENTNSTSDTFQIADSLNKELMDEKDIQPNNNKEIIKGLTDSAKISQAEAPVVVRLDAEERTLEDASVEGPEERLDPEGSINKLLVQGLCKKDEETMQKEEGNSDQAKDDCLESHGENHPTEADDTERQPTEEDMLQNANEAGSGDIHLQDVSSKEQPDKPKKLTSHKRPSTVINSDEGPSSKIHKTLNFELELKKNNKEDLIKELEQDLLLNISELPTFQSKSDHSSEKPDFEWDKDFENFLSEFPPIDEDHKTNENQPRRTKERAKNNREPTPSGSGRGRKYSLAGPTTPSLDSNTRVNSWKSSKKRHAPSTSNVGSPVKKQNTNTL